MIADNDSGSIRLFDKLITQMTSITFVNLFCSIVKKRLDIETNLFRVTMTKSNNVYL